MTFIKQTAIAVGALALSTFSALAAPLVPGGVIFTSGETFTPSNSGLVKNDNLIDFRMDPTPTTPFTNVGGRVQNRVVENASGNMVFMPRIRDTFNIDGGTFAISAFRIEGYGEFDVDAEFRTDGLGEKGFTSVSRSVDGNIMTFRYDDPMFIDAINPPGLQETSYFPALVTDATEYDFLGTMTIFGYLLPLGTRTPDPTASLTFVTIGGIAVPVIAAVPLPGAGLLLIGGIGSLAALRRRKQNS